MQRIQRRLILGYGLLFGGGLALLAFLALAVFAGMILAFPWAFIWYVLSAVPAAGIAILFLTSVEERKAAEARQTSKW